MVLVCHILDVVYVLFFLCFCTQVNKVNSCHPVASVALVIKSKKNTIFIVLAKHSIIVKYLCKLSIC